MSSITSAVKRHPLLSFAAIAYVTFYAAGVFMELFPSDFWYLFVYGSFLGGLVVTSIESGAAGRKAWLNRIFRWRLGWRWYGVAVGLPLAIGASVLGANLALGAPMPSRDLLEAWPKILPVFVFMFFFVTLGEEPGFRGFALPKLLAGRSALAAGLLIGAIHLGWHLPLLITGEVPLETIPTFFAIGILMTWMVVNTDGSILLPMVFHAAHNAFFAYTRDMFDGRYMAQENLLLSLVMCLVAVGIVAFYGPTLKSGKSAELPARPAMTQEPVLA